MIGTPTAWERQRQRLAWWLLLPTLAVLVVVALYPLAQTIGYSLTDARLASMRPTHFVGLRNYGYLLADRRFLSSLGLTLSFKAITVTAELVLGLIVALAVHGERQGRGLMRAAMLVPWAIPTVISAQMWKWMYHDIYGVLNDLGLRLGLLAEPVAWLAEPGLILAAVCTVDIWKTTPFVALMLLAGLQAIPRELYEAARVDGAGRWQQFANVTLPLLMPMLLVTLIFRTLDALRVFDAFFVMVGNRPGFMTLAVYNQQVLVNFARVGEGSAISMAIFAVIALVVALYMRLFRRWEA